MGLLPFDKIPLFASLPLDHRQELDRSMQRISLTPGALLCKEGEPGDAFFIVLQGEIEIIKALGTEMERLLRIEGPGEFLGELSLLDRAGKRTATVRARTEVVLAKMARGDFETLLQRRPNLAYDMLEVLSRRQRMADNATIRELQEKNRELTEAYQALQAAQAQIIEKEALERELRMAREIQQSILPDRMPEVPGYEFGGVMIPARHVAGDLYDFLMLDGGYVGVIIGDVAGKGAPAALFMALSASILRAEANVGRSPRVTLLRVNRLLQEISTAPMFITVIYGILDPSNGTFSYARAGHEVPAQFDASALLKHVRQDVGQILGILDMPELDVQTITLAQGDMLILYTDGVSEAPDAADQFFGLEGVQRAVAAQPAAPCQALCESIADAVIGHHGSESQEVDITLVAIRALPNNSRSTIQ
jgi:serine phosphatase RsbU (regulator of sigma subunit)